MIRAPRSGGILAAVIGLLTLITIGLAKAAATRGSAWYALGAAAVFVALAVALALVIFLDGAPLTAPDAADFLICYATLIAGAKRASLNAEWRTHLAGESGHDLVTWRKVGEASGFMASAIRCRLSDAADAAWVPVDAVLTSRLLSNAFVLGLTAITVVYVYRSEGARGVIDDAASISAVGASLYALVRVGRWWRNVKLPEPKARRAKNN